MPVQSGFIDAANLCALNALTENSAFALKQSMKDPRRLVVSIG
jgi:hypothetical protein